MFFGGNMRTSNTADNGGNIQETIEKIEKFKSDLDDSLLALATKRVQLNLLYEPEIENGINELVEWVKLIKNQLDGIIKVIKVTPDPCDLKIISEYYDRAEKLFSDTKNWVENVHQLIDNVSDEVPPMEQKKATEIPPPHVKETIVKIENFKSSLDNSLLELTKKAQLNLPLETEIERSINGLVEWVKLVKNQLDDTIKAIKAIPEPCELTIIREYYDSAEKLFSDNSERIENVHQLIDHVNTPTTTGENLITEKNVQPFSVDLNTVRAAETTNFMSSSTPFFPVSSQFMESASSSSTEHKLNKAELADLKRKININYDAYENVIVVAQKHGFTTERQRNMAKHIIFEIYDPDLHGSCTVAWIGSRTLRDHMPISIKSKEFCSTDCGDAVSLKVYKEDPKRYCPVLSTKEIITNQREKIKNLSDKDLESLQFIDNPWELPSTVPYRSAPSQGFRKV